MGVCECRNVFYFSKKVRWSQNDVLFLFYLWINLTMTTGDVEMWGSTCGACGGGRV